MRLKQIRIENFRCFNDLTVDLHPRLNVLVGENGAGKTAILDAIAAGLTPVLKHLSSANQRLSGPGIKDTDFLVESHDLANGKKQALKAKYARIALETTQGLHWDHWKSSITGAQPPEKIGQVDLNAHCQALQHGLQTEAPELLPVFAYYGAQRGSIEHPERLHASSINYEYPAAALVGALKSTTDFKEMLKWFNEAEATELRTNRDVSGEKYEPLRQLRAVRESIELMLGVRYRHPRFDRYHKFVVTDNVNKTKLQVSQLSQGYQSMLALAADFARRMAIANDHLPDYESASNHPQMLQMISDVDALNPAHVYVSRFTPLMAPAIMLVDEIDVHLHPAWQQHVLADLMKVFPCTQFIVTTHSPQVLSAVASEHILLLHQNRIYAAPNGTEGAEASRILKRVFGVETRAPDNPVTQQLNEYLALVYADQWDTEHAKALRLKLDQAYLGEEPALSAADLHIENRAWELSLENDAGAAS
jgi:predicted ATP-binding protein involved in virulence